MREETRLIIETTNRILSDLCTPGVVDATESGQFATQLWQTLNENGLILAGLPEHLGGAGGEMGDSLTVIRCAARFAAPIPIAETFIAASLANFVGATSFSGGVVTVANGEFELSENNTLTGKAKLSLLLGGLIEFTFQHNNKVQAYSVLSTEMQSS